MKLVLFDSFYTDRLKGSQPDVEGDFCGLDAAVMKAGQNLRSEVEAGGGRGYRSTRMGVDGLIAFAIAGGIRARDVGRERDVADAIERDIKNHRIVENGDYDRHEQTEQQYPASELRCGDPIDGHSL